MMMIPSIYYTEEGKKKKKGEERQTGKQSTISGNTIYRMIERRKTNTTQNALSFLDLEKKRKRGGGGGGEKEEKGDNIGRSKCGTKRKTRHKTFLSIKT